MEGLTSTLLRLCIVFLFGRGAFAVSTGVLDDIINENKKLKEKLQGQANPSVGGEEQQEQTPLANADVPSAEGPTEAVENGAGDSKDGAAAPTAAATGVSGAPGVAATRTTPVAQVPPPPPLPPLPYGRGAMSLPPHMPGHLPHAPLPSARYGYGAGIPPPPPLGFGVGIQPPLPPGPKPTKPSPVDTKTEKAMDDAAASPHDEKVEVDDGAADEKATNGEESTAGGDADAAH